MTGPDRIWVEDGEDCPYFYFESELADVGSPLVEYIRRDPAALAASRSAPDCHQPELDELK